MFGEFVFARHRGEDVVAAQHEQFRIDGDAHRCVARRARQQRGFAEEHAGAQGCQAPFAAADIVDDV